MKNGVLCKNQSRSAQMLLTNKNSNGKLFNKEWLCLFYLYCIKVTYEIEGKVSCLLAIVTKATGRSIWSSMQLLLQVCREKTRRQVFVHDPHVILLQPTPVQATWRLILIMNLNQGDQNINKSITYREILTWSSLFPSRIIFWHAILLLDLRT